MLNNEICKYVEAGGGPGDNAVWLTSLQATATNLKGFILTCSEPYQIMFQLFSYKRYTTSTSSN